MLIVDVKAEFSIIDLKLHVFSLDTETGLVINGNIVVQSG